MKLSKVGTILLRQARAGEAAVSLQRRSVEQGTDKITMDEINAEIKAIRKKRTR